MFEIVKIASEAQSFLSQISSSASIQSKNQQIHAFQTLMESQTSKLNELLKQLNTKPELSHKFNSALKSQHQNKFKASR